MEMLWKVHELRGIARNKGVIARIGSGIARTGPGIARMPTRIARLDILIQSTGSILSEPLGTQKKHE
ncbi:hypothetical protein, partial [Siminovitchia fortis]|uniref:hypothetical protein n=1 Tax=Siminovitchia fortis TaxID=254758 RepID=UPI001C92F5EB